MMIPENESAFAVYTGKIKSKKRKSKQTNKIHLESNGNGSGKSKDVLEKKLPQITTVNDRSTEGASKTKVFKKHNYPLIFESFLDDIKTKKQKKLFNKKKNLQEIKNYKKKRQSSVLDEETVNINDENMSLIVSQGKNAKKLKKINKKERSLHSKESNDGNMTGNSSDVTNKDVSLTVGTNGTNDSPAKKSRKRKASFASPDNYEESTPLINKNSPLPNKLQKKVCIATPEPQPGCSGVNSKMKKPIVYTPRFPNKAKTSSNHKFKIHQLDLSPEKSGIDTSVNETSLKDKYLRTNTTAENATEISGSECLAKFSLEKILFPVAVDTFMSENWETKPIHITNKNVKRFIKLISTEGIDEILREMTVQFGKHLDVTSYTNGKRETHNVDGRANAHVIWDFYTNGCSIRLLNPQYFFHNVHTLNSILQEYFGCFVGANSYLTPPMSQGFAPHYDDIEAFILQIEGSKIWRVYEPLDKNSQLPRHSSRNFKDEELGKPMFEVKLKPGDVLYLPRGYIHQGRTEEEHSLHLTLSVYQKTAYYDLLDKLLPLTLKKAAHQDLEFRRGLPIGYLKSAGLVHKKKSTIRMEMIKNVRKLVARLNDFIQLDDAVDQMGLSFMQDALPPVLAVTETTQSVSGDGLKMNANGKLQGQAEIGLETKVRWIRAFCYRVLEENVTLENGTIEKEIRIYHTLENSKEYQAEEPQYLIADPSFLPSLRHLTSAYPNFTKVSELPPESEDKMVLFISDLWDRGLIMTDSPLSKKIPFQASKVDEPLELSPEELLILADLNEKNPDDDLSEISSSSSEELSDIEETLKDTDKELSIEECSESD